ncbi:LppX_LprAFG lipoprotein [Nocardioides mangrovi]|uniref:LppX_LprAFG lipoprotein n=1 Tax=Nocardioides mangrovi TaxID=2874580 RepID=A0ABS7UHN8_9ACTN|nr:LppX_LprAFG lipoprotein [Nocardioides mangrovi]MBZ5740340.1 LppX_LprAFG lipoprotein [Nocardioides mangrovi]
MRLDLRRAAAATATVLLLGGITACGDSSDDSAAKDDSQQAALLSNLSEGDTVDPADFVKTVTDGLENSTTAHMTMTMDLGSTGAMTAEGDVDYTTDTPSVAMKMELPGAPSSAGEMDVRMVDGVMYLSMGELTQGKFWKIDPSDPDGPFASLGMDKLFDQMDPAKSLESMETGISKVTYVGDEDGLDHYELTMNVKKLMDSLGSDMGDMGGMGAQMPDSLTYDLWLDDQGRFAKMSMDDLAMGAAGSGSVEMTVSDWGEDVSIEAPPADQVTDMPDLGSMMGDLGGATASS